MIDIHLLRKDPQAVARRLATRGAGAFDINQYLELERRRKELQTSAEQAQAARNRLAKEIGQAKANKQDASSLLAQAESHKGEIQTLEQQLSALQSELEDFLRRVPNLPHASVPVGSDESGNVQVRRWGEPRRFGQRRFAAQRSRETRAVLTEL